VIIDTSNQVPVVGTVVYDGWGGNYCGNYGRVIQVQSYGVPYQPVYTTRYYTAPCSTVYYYAQPSCYYSQPCWQTSRRSYYRHCR
jgi:hypothetical protein